jgi:hypothetical protein
MHLIRHHPNQEWLASWLSNQPTFDISSRRKKTGIFLFFFFLLMYVIQHSFICRPSDSPVSEKAAIEPRAVATLALTPRRSNHWSRSYPPSARSHPPLARSHPHLARSHPPLARPHPPSARSQNLRITWMKDPRIPWRPGSSASASSLQEAHTCTSAHNFTF